MPYKPKTPCKHRGCPELVHGAYCDEHRKQNDREYNENHRRAGHNKRYGRAWKKKRGRFISKNTLCVLCEKRGIFTPAEEIHHIIPTAEGGTDSEDNLMALCKSCHRQMHPLPRNGKVNKHGEN